jgi:hypothetical protein
MWLFAVVTQVFVLSTLKAVGKIGWIETGPGGSDSAWAFRPTCQPHIDGLLVSCVNGPKEQP